MVLLLAMIFLLLLALLAGTAMRSATLALRLAGNDQFREQALQRAQAVVAAIAREPANFPLSIGVGQSLCPPDNDDLTGCDYPLAELPDTVRVLPAGVALNYRVLRKGPLLLGRLPVRLSQAEVSSSRAYRAAVFEAQAVVDGNAARSGSAAVAQGVAVLVARPGQ
jgi:hypothetical protein